MTIQHGQQLLGGGEDREIAVRPCSMPIDSLVIWAGKSKEIPYAGKPARSDRGAVLILSKLTSKAQTTILQPIRSALGLQPGDELLYEIIDGRVILTKARTGTTADDPFRSFGEWHSEADARAYAEL